jgi:hypothetical protein
MEMKNKIVLAVVLVVLLVLACLDKVKSVIWATFMYIMDR